MDRGFSEEKSAETVLARMDDAKNERLKEVMTSVIKHLHAVVKEVEPTMDEWMAAIQFLTATGQMCDDKRQEWILLSDTLGVSMLVDAINNRKPGGATESTVLGPFFVEGAPEVPLGSKIYNEAVDEPCVMSGRVTDLDGNPIANALLDVWQSDTEGFYDVQKPDEGFDLRVRLQTNENGEYWFVTSMPCAYPIPTDGPVGAMLTQLGRHPYRPAHVHFIVQAEGYEPVTTHIFPEGGEYLDSDAVFGVKESLIIDFPTSSDEEAAQKYGVESPFRYATYDFVLNPGS
ncbi:MAG: 6-chlorohydroxyquinol-1,2-dioxygenase [Kordiimonas sp.]|nr:6-chlorohydroxyquinol-1,2-dioxygenase [Kordiimonas sp.]|tara:strand:- start:2617 stop:3480 length:864 start_codon:yes stop_codon:yes gene_type:complete